MNSSDDENSFENVRQRCLAKQHRYMLHHEEIK